MLFDPGFALSTVPKIAGALWTSILVALLSCVGASLLGFGLEIARRSNRVMRYAMRFLIDFIRSTPLLVQLYFVLPSYGIKLPALAIGVIAISLYYSGYLAEVFKAGIDGVKPGQFEAARALGLTRLQTVVLVIAPQMLRNIAAPWATTSSASSNRRPISLPSRSTKPSARHSTSPPTPSATPSRWSWSARSSSPSPSCSPGSSGGWKSACCFRRNADHLPTDRSWIPPSSPG
ncbi:amino acid ABC transporter permease [uncultured Bosea sp.]|uniref:amino acid ABC transporter permease n=1 Tax=uncultured Bosea sp. TaxID=211457 RepID=UPI0025F91386|nr:amino acid ABC transporter permease [uncultured Bosea sp.]